MSEPMISIRNLYKVFGGNPEGAMEHVRAGMGKDELQATHGHVLGLKDINVDLMEGEITVIMGLSGSGKSTLVRHINRLIDPTDGQVLVQGENVLDYDEDKLRDMRRRQMSMVFQHFALLPHRNVLLNTATAPIVRGEDKADYEPEAKKWLERVGLGGYEESYPHQLSGGMKQRVGIARALTSNAPIMLMDEAFSALDPLIRTDMQDLLLELQVELNKTIVFISHDLDEALKLADHLVILKDGQVVQQGEPQHILLNPEDDYIVDFISDINRARVLRVRSIMEPLNSGTAHAGEIQREDTLEQVIAQTGGESSGTYLVKHEGEPVGELKMSTLVRSLVPQKRSGH
ncbi:MAG: betaine/proline/choline family ABC transporter ATP-binding protein [Cognatishimia sp.]|uniref:quaternary amine ABC transporter ATP-binding protein n=1 Tax=Cognatishimia sp. TaxID=2211648 RepID=UPI003B8C8B93